MVEVHVLAEVAVLVNQKTESSLLFKEGFSAAFCNKPLDVILSRGHSFQILRREKKTTKSQDKSDLIPHTVTEERCGGIEWLCFQASIFLCKHPTSLVPPSKGIFS